jgi:hypothetical protein
MENLEPTHSQPSNIKGNNRPGMPSARLAWNRHRGLCPLHDHIDSQIIQRRCLMKVKGNVTLIDEPTYVASLDCYIASWVQHPFGRLEAPLPPGYAMDNWPTIKWTWQGLTGPDRPRIGLGLIQRLWRSIRMRFSRARRLRQHVELYLGGQDGRRLSVSQAVKGNCRGSLEAQSADSQSGDDDN